MVITGIMGLLAMQSSTSGLEGGRGVEKIVFIMQAFLNLAEKAHMNPTADPTDQ